MIWYLHPTMHYLYDQILALGRERAVVFAAIPVQPERFPLDRVYIAERPPEPPPPTRNTVLVVPPFHVQWRPLVQEEKVGLLHCHDGRAAPEFLPLALECGIPIVTTFLGYDVSASLNDPWSRAALPVLFRKGDLFTVMSQDMGRQIERLGCPREKIRVIYHGIDLSRFLYAPRRAPKSGPVILLTAGRLIPKKGPDDLARAFALACRWHSNVVLRVVGEGALQSEMERILTEAGVRDRAEFLGRLEPEQVAREMERAHLFCLPSRVGPNGDSEGIPNVLKEAMAVGMPVVSTYHAGIPELVEDGVSGYLVPERDVEGIADRLDRLLRNPGQWEVMGRAGRTKVETEFSWDKITRQLEEEVYTPLLGRIREGGLAPQRINNGGPRSAPIHL
jgi:colanic acid/amylovoran biosynthesis glycosyltransferase